MPGRGYSEERNNPALASEVSAMVRRLTGKCLCGATVYEVDDAFSYAMNCHCSNCRRATGAAFKPFAGIQRDRLKLVAGNEHVMIFGDADRSHDVHCGTCGSLLYSIVREGAYAHVAMGTLVDDPTIRASAHIFVGSMANWHKITDDLPQFSEFPK
jgi:hypothetical protein